MQFKSTEPVQVQVPMIDADSVPNTYWRNALYLHCQSGHHHVLYANGEKEVLNNATKIRAYERDAK